MYCGWLTSRGRLNMIFSAYFIWLLKENRHSDPCNCPILLNPDVHHSWMEQPICFFEKLRDITHMLWKVIVELMISSFFVEVFRRMRKLFHWRKKISRNHRTHIRSQPPSYILLPFYPVRKLIQASASMHSLVSRASKKLITAMMSAWEGRGTEVGGESTRPAGPRHSRRSRVSTLMTERAHVFTAQAA